MIDAQTKSELPKYGASTRLAAISTPSRTPPQRKTVARTGSVAAAGGAASRDEREARRPPAAQDASRLGHPSPR